MSKRDKIYAVPQQDVSGFEFDTAVAAVFPDMIQRSVPGYASVVAMSGFLAQRFAQPDTNIYDLGCSLGATSLAIINALEPKHSNCRIYAVDNSDAMLQQAQVLFEQHAKRAQLIFSQQDVNAVEIDNASLIAMNYTLQFIALENRDRLLRRLAEGTNAGGVLILSEKIAFPDDKVDELFIDLHHDFKRSKGYSDLEISQKRAAIDNVLVPETLDAHKQRLLDAGYARVELWFQCLNFASLVAFK